MWSWLFCVEHLNYGHYIQFSSVQSLSRVRLFATPWIAARQASLSITNSQGSLRLTSIESVMPSSHLILCRPLLLLLPIPPNIRVFSNESTLCMRWPKYWSFSFSIIPSKEIPLLCSYDFIHKFWNVLASRCYRNLYLLLLLSRFSRVRLCATPETAAYQDPPSLGFSRQEHWIGLPFPSPMHESEKWKWSRSVVSNS